MAITQADQPPAQLAELDRIVGDSSLELLPKRISAARFVDQLGEEAWLLTLILPRPTADTWDREAVFTSRLFITREFDRLIAGTALELPGQTLAVVTTDEAREDDVAQDGEPEVGEDTAPTTEDLD